VRSVLESLQAEPLAPLPDAAIEEHFADLQEVSELLEAERLRHLAEIERRGLFERDGHLSCAAWLAARFRLGWAEARRQVQLARSLQGMPATRLAVDEGQISMAAARVLGEAHRAHPEAFLEIEEQLVEAARIHSVADLHRVATLWRQGVADDQLGRCDDSGLRARRSLHTSLTFGGMVRLDGDLDPETGETLLTALGAVLDAEARSRTQDDTRSPAQRRADALGEVAASGSIARNDPTLPGSDPT
jgi:hypothetical protein